MIIEHPYNPSSGLLLTTATNMIVVIYTDSKWIEFRPTTQQAMSNTQTLVVQNLKNMPFMIPAGVKFNLRLWVDIGQREVNIYDPKPTAQTNKMTHVELNPTPTPSLIL